MTISPPHDDRKGQYISNKAQRGSLLEELRAERASHDNDKIGKALLWLKGLGWRKMALLGFILVVDLLELTAIDAQVPLGQLVTAQTLQEAFEPPLLHGRFLAERGLGHHFANLKDRLGEAQVIGVQRSLECGAIHQGPNGKMHRKEGVELLAHAIGGVGAQDLELSTLMRFDLIDH